MGGGGSDPEQNVPRVRRRAVAQVCSPMAAGVVAVWQRQQRVEIVEEDEQLDAEQPAQSVRQAGMATINRPVSPATSMSTRTGRGADKPLRTRKILEALRSGAAKPAAQGRGHPPPDVVHDGRRVRVR